MLLTHAHEDHVGALPYLMREVKVPEVWGTRLTLGLLQPKLDEHGLLHATELKEAVPGRAPVEIGAFRAEFVRMAHSVPDTVAIVLEVGGLRIVHTGDYKLDHTPVDGLRTDVGRLAEIGNRGVDLMLGDSTNAERPGVTGSERLVGEAFRQIIPVREGRVLVASFASNVHRMQQAVDVAVETGRKVCVIGRSMRKNLNIARNLGYLEAPDDTFIRPPELDQLAPHEAMVLCTGSQGEPMSALTRIAYRDHPSVTVERGDTVILSAKPVPGNELRVHDTINRLAKAGAEVLHQEIAPVHVSGHGNSEEIRTILGLVRPKAVMPVHGEFRMLAAHAQLARDSRCAGGLDRAGRERERRRAGRERAADRGHHRDGRHVRRRARSGGRARRRAPGPAAPVRARRPDRRRHGRRERACDRIARADRARLRRDRAARRRAAGRGGARCSTTAWSRTSPRSSSSRSISTTRSPSSCTTGRGGGR